MDLFDIFNIPVEVDTFQLLMFVLGFFLIGFAFLMSVIISKGYELNAKWITQNLAIAMASVVLFGMALGVFVIAMILSPGYVSVPFGNSERIEMGITLFIIAFLASMSAVTFLVYTKRGGF